MAAQGDLSAVGQLADDGDHVGHRAFSRLHAVELMRSLAYSISRGLPYATDRQLLATLRENYPAPLGQVLDVRSLPRAGKANLGLNILRFEHVALVCKKTAVLREYFVTKALCGQEHADAHARFFAVGAKGPVFQIFQEYLPAEAGELEETAHSRLVLGLADALSACVVANSVPLPRVDYRPLKTPSLLAHVSALTGDSIERITMALNAIEGHDWRVQHNDLHNRNIRKRACGKPVSIDFATVAWNIEGADFYRLVPNGRISKAVKDRFETITGIAAAGLGKSARPLRQAALLQAAVRHRRRAVRHRDRRRSLHAAEIVADAVTLL